MLSIKSDVNPPTCFPKTLALIDSDFKYTESLSKYLCERGVAVDVFDDSNSFLAHSNPYDYEFYLVELMLPGIDGAELIKVLRMRSEAGVLVVSGSLAADVFCQAINAGADMYLAKPVQFEHVALAVKAVFRRTDKSRTVTAPWRLDRRARQLVAPDGTRVGLSKTEQYVMECFIEANGESVTREVLRQRIGRNDDTDNANGLTATVYRPRKRIERATPTVIPLQSKSRVGYVFKAPLRAI